MWNLLGECLKTTYMQSGVNALSVSPLRNLLVCGLDNGEIVIYDLAQHVERYRYVAHEKEVTNIGINI